MLLFKSSFYKGFFRDELHTTNLMQRHFRYEETETLKVKQPTLQLCETESELERRFLDPQVTVLYVISSCNTLLWPVWEW